MIIVNLTGGLGDQLFQYALGRKLAIKNNVALRLDISGFEVNKLHRYVLFNYHIAESIATAEEVAALREKHRQENPSLPSYQRAVIKEAAFPYSPEILNAPAEAYLDGYWQTEKYFSSIECVLREDFTLKSGLNQADRAVAADIASCGAISLYIRRGHYVGDNNSRETRGACSLDYYQAAARMLAEHLDNPRFFIFSDDPDWAQENLRLEYPIQLVRHNGPDRDYADLWLMSQCQHHIVANSSFSWWGAWLNAKPGKRVVAPEPWFDDPSLDTRDLIPAAWHKLPKSGSSPNTLAQAMDLETTVQLFALAGRGALGIIDLVHAVEKLNASRQGHSAIALYRMWLENTLSPLSYAIYFNLGAALDHAHDETGAEQAYRDALARKPDFLQARSSLAVLLRRQGRAAEAEEYERGAARAA